MCRFGPITVGRTGVVDVREGWGAGMVVQDTHIAQLRHLLGTGNLRAALEYLGAVAPYRFAALYRFAGEDLHNLILVDRERPGSTPLPVIPVDDSYCTFVRKSRDSFILEDSFADRRVDGHCKRPVVRSYCGVSLRDARGRVFGTVCLFDYDAVERSDAMVVLLREVAAALDPDAVLAAVAEGLDHGMEALASMVELIASASPDAASALEAFGEYAAPLRNEAATRLQGTRREAFEARMRALSDDFDARVRALHAGPGVQA